MPRPSKPWYRKSRQEWCVTIDGKLHKLGPDKDEAFVRFHRIMSNRGHEVSVEEDYLAPLYQLFIDWCGDNKSKRTTEDYFGYLNSFNERWPGLRVSDLKPYHLQRWVDEQNWGSTRKRNACNAVLRALNWLVSQHMIDQSPLRGFSRPSAQTRTTTVSKLEFDEILGHVRDAEFRDLLTVAYDSGARPQELRILEARHIELSDSLAVIPASEAKGNRVRGIYCATDRSMAILRRLIEEHPTGPIFRNRRGSPWTAFALNSRFCRLKKKLGRKFRMYDFRHGYITRSLKAGVDVHTVAALAGHANSAMIDKVYSHITQDREYMRRQAKRAAE